MGDTETHDVPCDGCGVELQIPRNARDGLGYTVKNVVERSAYAFPEDFETFVCSQCEDEGVVATRSHSPYVLVDAVFRAD